MAQPFELKFVTNLADLLGDVKRFGDGLGQAAKAVGEIGEASRATSAGVGAISEAATRNAETITAMATAAQTAVTAEQAEAVELERLTELLGSEANARASLNAQIIDMTATQVASEEEMAASLERRAAIMTEVREREAERTAAQRDAAAATAAHANEEVAAAEAVHQVQAVGISDATQAALAKTAAGEAAANLAVQIQDLAQAQRNLREIEASEPTNTALISRARQELAVETRNVAEAERAAAAAKQASAQIADRLATAEKRAADATRGRSFSEQAQGLGQLLTTVGLINPPLLRLGVGLQMIGQMAESSFGAAGGAAGGFAAVLLPFAAAAAVALTAVGVAAGFVKEAIAAAVPQQSSETSFALLLGDTEKARERLEELDGVAARFRLDPEGVRAASEELTRLSQGALGSGKSLETVIEVSARTGKSLGETGALIGRLYETIQSGQPVGRMAQQLVRLGVISASDINHLNNLHKEGAKGPQIWDEAQAAIGRYSGAAQARANTFAGATQGIRGAWSQMLEVFGRPIVDALTPFLRGVSDVLLAFKPVAELAGQAVGAFLLAAAQGMQVVAGIINGDFAGAASHLTNLLLTAVPIVSSGTALIADLVKAAFYGLQTAILNLGVSIVSALANTFDQSIALASGFVKTMTNVLSMLPGAVKQSVDAAVDNATLPARTALTLIRNAAESVTVDAAKNAARSYFDAQRDALALGSAISRGQPGAPNDGTKFKPVTPGAVVEPDGSGKGGPSGRKREVDAAKEAEKAYREQLEATKDSLALGEITVAQAQEKNTQTINASIARFKELQAQLSPTSEKYLQLEAAIKKAQLALAQQSVYGQVRSKLIELRNEFGDLGKQLSGQIASQINGAIDSISNTLGQLAMGVNNTKQAFENYIQSTITGLIKLAAQQLTSYILSKTLKQQQTTDTLTNNAATQASNTTTGLLESITSYGVAAAVGAAAFLAAMAISGGFERGGYTGGREGEPVGVVHGEEFVFSAPATRHWGLSTLQTMSQMRIPVSGPRASSLTSAASTGGYSPTGRAAGPRGRRGGDQPPVHIHYHADENAMKRFIAGNQGRHIILSHVNGSAVDLGNPTT